jgi:hypothetical protein
MFLSDGFNGESLNNSWRSITEVGPSVSDGALHIVSPPYHHRNPFVYLTYDPFPKDTGFEFEVRFRYVAVTGYGTGFGISNYDPRGGNREGSNFLRVWQDSTNYPLSIFTAGSELLYSTYHKDMSWHTVKVVYTADRQYDLFFDDTLVNSITVPLERDTGLWFGNDREVWPPGDWTGFEVDYVQIKSY